MKYFLLLLVSIGFICCKKTPPDREEKVESAHSEGIKNNYQQWESMGFHTGDHSPDFTLFSRRGHEFHLYEELYKRNKPMLFITGSYTCDITRHNLNVINNLSAAYKDKIDTYMVYTIEAHPADVPSPYSNDDKVWVVKNNVKDSVSEKQPTTYGERLRLARKWKRHYNIGPRVLVDSPDNYFWNKFGQAPNMAYLILPDGTIYFRETWFNKEEMTEQINNLLSLDSIAVEHTTAAEM